MTWRETLEGLKQELTDVRAVRQRRVEEDEAGLKKERDDLSRMSRELGLDGLLAEMNATLLGGKGEIETPPQIGDHHVLLRRGGFRGIERRFDARELQAQRQHLPVENAEPVELPLAQIARGDELIFRQQIEVLKFAQADIAVAELFLGENGALNLVGELR